MSRFNWSFMRMREHHFCTIVICLAGLMWSTSVIAQEREYEARIEAAQVRIDANIEAGEALERLGRTEQAREHYERAEAMESELHAWIEQLEHAHDEPGVRHESPPHFIRVIEHLEHAMMILKEHGNTELAMQINRVADQIRERVHREPPEREREAEHSERAMSRRQIEVIRSALPALREGERGDAVELAELAIRARELGLEGRRDEEAQHIRERAPRGEDLRRILGMSIELYQEFGMVDRAEMLARNVREVFPVREGARERERVGGEARRSDREALEHAIEVMRLALPALMEADRPDTAELLESAIRARVIMLEGRRDEEAVHFLESAPEPGAVVEIMGYASRLWAEFGHEEKAHVTGQLAERLGRDLRSRREGGQERELDARMQEMQRMERQIRELEHALMRLQDELAKLRSRE